MKWTMLLLGLLFLLYACSGGIKGEQYRDKKPTFDLPAFFNGPIQAWGLIQDRSGNITARFDVDMLGTWKGKEGVLEERFRFYDDKPDQHRTWHIKALDNGRYEGRAGDIIGQATGQSFGNAVNWQYTMDVPVGDTHYRLAFDDWMWAMQDGTVMNRSYLKKWGIKVAEITIFMQKRDQHVKH